MYGMRKSTATAKKPGGSFSKDSILGTGAKRKSSKPKDAPAKKAGNYDDMTFKQAFAAARKADPNKNFKWKGKMYTTELAKPTKKLTKAGSTAGTKKNPRYVGDTTKGIPKAGSTYSGGRMSPMLKSQIKKDKKKEIEDNTKKTKTKTKAASSSAPTDKGVKKKPFVPLIDQVFGKNKSSMRTQERLKAAKDKKSQDTLDAMSFSKAFKAEQARLGEGKKFNWKGKSYTTDSKK
tara:strand:+ start:4379 stop:5080 length:702 start_codon:yes stop_codon:yes gene_type:complete